MEGRSREPRQLIPVVWRQEFRGPEVRNSRDTILKRGGPGGVESCPRFLLEAIIAVRERIKANER